MFRRINLATLIGVIVLLSAISAVAQDREVIHPAANADQMINEIGMREQVANYEALSARKGLQARKDGAFVGEKVVADSNGRTSRSKMILIPFSGASGKVEATVLMVVRESEDGEIQESFTFYSSGDAACDCKAALPDHPISTLPQDTVNGSNLLFATSASASPWSNYWELVNLIISRNWSGVRNWIYGKLASGITDSLLAPVVRSAFESRGYYCPNPPWWVPFKSIWYVATCAGRAY